MRVRETLVDQHTIASSRLELAKATTIQRSCGARLASEFANAVRVSRVSETSCRSTARPRRQSRPRVIQAPPMFAGSPSAARAVESSESGCSVKPSSLRMAVAPSSELAFRSRAVARSMECTHSSVLAASGASYIVWWLHDANHCEMYIRPFQLTRRPRITAERKM